MIWQLIRRDPAWKILPWVLLICAAASSAGIKGLLWGFVLTLPIFLSIYTLFAQAEMTKMQIPLPIEVRDIYLLRVAATGLLIWLPVGCFWIARQLSTKAFEMAALMTLFVLAGQALALRHPRSNFWMFYLFFPGIIGTDLIVSSRSVVFLGVCSGACVGLFTWTLMKMPRSFQEVSRKTHWQGFPWPRWMWWRIAYPWQYWVLLGLFGAEAMVRAFVTMVFFWTMVVTMRQSSNWLLNLPIGRSRLFAMTIVPILAVCAAGVVPDQSESDVHLRDRDCGTPNVVAPFEYRIPAVDGAVPMVVAPWGESYRPLLTTFLRTESYNPFEVGCHSSRQFMTFQYRRANQAIHRRGWRLKLVDLSAMTGFALFVLMLLLLTEWRVMKRFPKPIRWSPMVIIALCYFGGITYRNVTGQVSVWLMWALPGKALPLILAVPLLLYVIGDRLFRQAEIIVQNRVKV